VRDRDDPRCELAQRDGHALVARDRHPEGVAERGRRSDGTMPRTSPIPRRSSSARRADSSASSSNSIDSSNTSPEYHRRPTTFDSGAGSSFGGIPTGASSRPEMTM